MGIPFHIQLSILIFSLAGATALFAFVLLPFFSFLSKGWKREKRFEELVRRGFLKK